MSVLVCTARMVRHARWGTDDIAEGFLRFSCGIEDTADVLAEVTKALNAASR